MSKGSFEYFLFRINRLLLRDGLIICSFNKFTIMLFEDLNLIEPILRAVKAEGYSEPTPIQEKAIPVLLKGKDLLGCAQTGTGKTAAFAIPILQLLNANQNSSSGKRPVKALIITPTRELAIQINESFSAYGKYTSPKHTVIYGGVSQSAQTNILKNGVDILIATPGRLLDLMNQGFISLQHIQFFVLDEADRMLDIGFYDDIMRIISYLPKNRQTLMFSATMPPNIRSMSKHVMKKPVEIALKMSKPAEGVLQVIYKLSDNQKLPLINSLIADHPEYRSILIFSSTKKKLSEIVRGLRSKYYLVEGISSDLEQKEREEMLLRFRSRKTLVLVATDVLSRGIDIKDIDLVINFDAPSDAEDYVHRVGRTARAETTGVAVTLINRMDMQKMQRIEKLIGYPVNIAPLPTYIAEMHEKRPDHQPSPKKSGKGEYKRRYNQKGKRQGARDRNSI